MYAYVNGLKSASTLLSFAMNVGKERFIIMQASCNQEERELLSH
jgi:hypothetical protein